MTARVPAVPVDRRRALLLAVLCLPVGVAVGTGWALLSPRPRLRVVEQGLVPEPGTVGSYVAADGWFAVLALAAGLLVAVVAALATRGASPATLLGTVVGGVLGSLVAWGTGELVTGWLGGPAAEPAVGSVVSTGPDLRAWGVLLLWPLVSAVVGFVAAFLSEPAAETRSPRPRLSTHGAPAPARRDPSAPGRTGR